MIKPNLSKLADAAVFNLQRWESKNDYHQIEPRYRDKVRYFCRAFFCCFRMPADLDATFEGGDGVYSIHFTNFINEVSVGDIMKLMIHENSRDRHFDSVENVIINFSACLLYIRINLQPARPVDADSAGGYMIRRKPMHSSLASITKGPTRTRIVDPIDEDAEFLKNVLPEDKSKIKKILNAIWNFSSSIDKIDKIVVIQTKTRYRIDAWFKGGMRVTKIDRIFLNRRRRDPEFDGITEVFLDPKISKRCMSIRVQKAKKISQDRPKMGNFVQGVNGRTEQGKRRTTISDFIN